MLLSVSFTEITSILKNRFNIAVSLVNAGDGKVRVKYDAGSFLGELSADVGLNVGNVKNELILSLSSQIPGFNKIFEGLLLFIDAKMPYKAMTILSERKAKLSLAQIPQLDSVFNMLSLTDVNVINDKIEISVGIN